MIKFNRLAVSSAAAVLMAALVFSGCSKKDAGEQTETTAESESGEGTDESAESSADDSTAQITEDEEKISALDPQRPDNLGEVKKLNYKGLSFEAPKEEEITDQSVDDYLTGSVLPYMQVTASDNVVKDGDTVNIAYVGTIDGEEFDGGSADSYDLAIGSDSFIDGFEDGLIGKHYGETVKLNLKFPDDYGKEDLAGKDVVFTVDINSIKRTLTLDELDDAAAAEISNGEASTVADLKALVKENLTRNAMISAKSSLYNNAITAALEASEVEPTEDTVTWQIDSALKSYDKNLQAQGFNLATYLSWMGTNYDDFRATLQEDAKEAAKEVMLRHAICDAEGLSFNDDTKQQYLDEFGYTAEQLDSYADESEQEEAVIWYLSGKAIADNANVTYVEETEASAEAAEAVAEETEAAETEAAETEAETDKAAE